VTLQTAGVGRDTTGALGYRQTAVRIASMFERSRDQEEAFMTNRPFERPIVAGMVRWALLACLLGLASCGGERPVLHHYYHHHRPVARGPRSSFAARTRARCEAGDRGACRMLRAMR
jgi:hypothetical protein